jgi:hypothetical protein
VPGIVTFALVPVVIFGFMDTMYLAQEKAYRELYKSTIDSVRARSYTLVSVYGASAKLRSTHVGKAFLSWSIFPVYLGLVVAYVVAHCAGWLATVTAVAK